MNDLLANQNHIKTAAREIRVTATGLRLALLPPAGGHAAALAQAIHERWGATVGRWPLAGLVWRQQHPALLLQPHYRQVALHLAPRLAVALLQQVTQQVSYHPVLRTVVHTERIEPGRRPQGTLPTPSPRSQPPADMAAQSPARPATPVPSPVPRIVLHQHTVEQRAARQEAAVQPGQPGRWEALTPAAAGRLQSGPAQPAAPVRLADLPAVDVDRLADQVIKSIDRRIIAQRERLGKV